MQKIFLLIAFIAISSFLYSQNKSSSEEISVRIAGGQHCSCWDWGGKLPAGTCLPGGFICLSWAIVNPNPEHIDKLSLDLSKMTATYRVHINNFSELEKVISNNKIQNDYDNSMIDDEILKYFVYSENNKVRIKKGEYAYELVNDYYTFSVNLEEILP